MPYPIKKKRSHFRLSFLQSQFVSQAEIFFSHIGYCVVPNRTLLCTVCLCCIHHVFISIHMYLSCIYMNCIVW